MEAESERPARVPAAASDIWALRMPFLTLLLALLRMMVMMARTVVS